MNAYLIAATALLLGLLPCGWVMLRSPAIDGIVALELAGIVVTLALLCLSEGYHRQVYFGVPMVAAPLVWIGGLVYVRFLGREL